MNRYLKISSIIGFGLLVVSCRNNQGNSAGRNHYPPYGLKMYNTEISRSILQQRGQPKQPKPLS